MNNSPIGVYDSGFGGLSVWRELQRELPEESLIYLGDGKNCPNGSLPMELIREIAEEAVETLVERGCKMVVVACNTATSAAIAYLRERFDQIPIVGLEPAIKPACLRTKSRVVGVVATERSLESEKFLSTLARYGEGVKVIKSVGEGFVEAVEANEESSAATLHKVRAVIEPIVEQGADIIVLGCTHYPLLMEKIKQFTPSHIRIIAQGEYVANSLRDYLNRHPEMDIRCAKHGKTRFLTTESEQKFEESASIFLQQENIKVESISLE